MRIVAMVLGVVWASAVAQGANFKSEYGYSFSYPDAWTVVTNDQLKEAKRIASEHGFKPPEEVDLTRGPCVVADLNDRESQYAPNVNMVVGNVGALQVKESNLAKFREMILSTMQRKGTPPSGLEVRMDKAAGRDAFRATWSADAPGSGIPIRGCQVVVAGGRNLYLFTCVAAVSDYPRYEKPFEAIISSLQVEGEADAGLPQWAPYGIVAVLVVGLIAGIHGLVRRWTTSKKTRIVVADQGLPPPGK